MPRAPLPSYTSFPSAMRTVPWPGTPSTLDRKAPLGSTVSCNLRETLENLDVPSEL